MGGTMRSVGGTQNAQFLGRRYFKLPPLCSRIPPATQAILTSAATLYVRRSLALIISSRDCREADSRDTSPRHACLGEVSRKIWLHDFAINNNGGSVPVIFISLVQAEDVKSTFHIFTNLHPC